MFAAMLVSAISKFISICKSYSSEVTKARFGDIFYFFFYGKPLEFKQERSRVRSGHSLQHLWRG